jgi:hypothetical protein
VDEHRPPRLTVADALAAFRSEADGSWERPPLAAAAPPPNDLRALGTTSVADKLEALSIAIVDLTAWSIRLTVLLGALLVLMGIALAKAYVAP